MKRLLSLLLLAGVCAGVNRASAFDALIAFGDSLTDTGNEPAEPYAHFEGRWSNGPLWVEYLSVRLGFDYNPSNNLAHSGAQCDDTFGQVRDYVPEGDINNTLFVVWAGGNDFLQEYDKYWFNDDGWDRQIAYSVGGLSNAVVNLHDKGAKFILVPNTVDITTIPLLNRLPNFLRSYLRAKVVKFNNKLAKALVTLQASYPDITIDMCDTFALEKAILKNYKSYGFKKQNIDALSDWKLLDKSFDGPGARYVFWDPIHPTSKAHSIIADSFYISIGSPAPAAP
jgi:phospholipase/lecithinase/hemolysin